MSGEVAEAAFLTFFIALAATLTASIAGIPAGAWLATARFRGRAAVVAISNALMSTPTVLIGLVVAAFLSRRGPLGGANLLYTPVAMWIGESLLALPLVIALSRGAVEGLGPIPRETALTLGAGRARVLLTLAREATPALFASTLGAFGRVVSEVGVAMMVGGNIRGETRTLATAMTLASQRGDFELAFQLGALLLVLALGVILAAEWVRR